jgi:hypothetical protein
MLNPGTVVYVGYTDLSDDRNLDPAVNPTSRRTSFPYLDTGRQLSVKASYLLRYRLAV